MAAVRASRQRRPKQLDWDEGKEIGQKREASAMAGPINLRSLDGFNGITRSADMSPLILIVASTHLSILATVNIAARPSKTLDECRRIGELAIEVATAKPSRSASYICHDTTREQSLTGVLGVVAYVSQEDGKITILEGYMATMSDCKVAGMAATASKAVPGVRTGAWACYDLGIFEQ